MKNILIMVSCSIVLVGCNSTNFSKLAKELSKDNATVVGNVGTVYGTVKIIRTNPGTNQDVVISPDGTVTIKSH